MPNIIPPIVSSSPPPLSPVEDDNEDDDFGDFTAGESVDLKDTYEASWKPSNAKPPPEKYSAHENGLSFKDSDHSLAQVVVHSASSGEENCQQHSSDTSVDSASPVARNKENISEHQHSCVQTPMIQEKQVEERTCSVKENCSDDMEDGNTENSDDFVCNEDVSGTLSSCDILEKKCGSELVSNSNLFAPSPIKDKVENDSIDSRSLEDQSPSVLSDSSNLGSSDILTLSSVIPQCNETGNRQTEDESLENQSNSSTCGDTTQSELTSKPYPSSSTYLSSASFSNEGESKKIASDSEEDESVKAMIVPAIPVEDEDVRGLDRLKYFETDSDPDNSDIIAEFQSPSRRPTLVLSDDVTDSKSEQHNQASVESDRSLSFAPEDKYISEKQNETPSYSDFAVDYLKSQSDASDFSPENDFSEFADFSQAEPTFRVDFTSENVTEHWAKESTSHEPVQCDECTEFDDFNDFESAEFQESETVKGLPSEKIPMFDFLSIKSHLDSIFKELFPSVVEPGGTSDLCLDSSSGVGGIVLDVEDSPVWQGLRDLEATPSLSFQWPGSHSNRGLLGSLNIDSRNILFGPKWNTVVPRFAANLGFSPLEPVRAIQTQPADPPIQTDHLQPQLDQINRTPLASGFQDSVPAAQFDWNDSGLVNPLDSVKDQSRGVLATTYSSGNPPVASSQHSAASSASGRDPKLSPEAARILDSLPELAFLSARMLMFPVQSESSAPKL